jgi:hypothetical protein
VLPGGDEPTPTSKLRRKPIAEKYAPEIAALYESGDRGFDRVEHLRRSVEELWNVGDAGFMEPFAEDAVWHHRPVTRTTVP